MWTRSGAQVTGRKAHTCVLCFPWLSDKHRLGRWGHVDTIPGSPRRPEVFSWERQCFWETQPPSQRKDTFHLSHGSRSAVWFQTQTSEQWVEAKGNRPQLEVGAIHGVIKREWAASLDEDLSKSRRNNHTETKSPTYKEFCVREILLGATQLHSCNNEANDIFSGYT